ncbi:MAG: hypothetical protein LBK82_03315 [Planctomycetaceae bacterium]|nr:hypothetical protein [Planctomycetaceae bacterium]
MSAIADLYAVYGRKLPTQTLGLSIITVNLIHCRRVRRHDLSAKGRLPYVYLPDINQLLTKFH